MSQSKACQEIERKTRRAQKLLEKIKAKHQNKKLSQPHPSIHNSGISFKTCFPDNIISDLYFKLFSKHPSHHDPAHTSTEIEAIFIEMREEMMKLSVSNTEMASSLQKISEQKENLYEKLEMKEESIKEMERREKEWENKFKQKLHQIQQSKSSESKSDWVKQFEAELQSKNMQLKKVWESNRDLNDEIKQMKATEREKRRQTEQLREQIQNLNQLVKTLTEELENYANQSLPHSNPQEFESLRLNLAQKDEQLQRISAKLSQRQKRHEIDIQQLKNGENSIKSSLESKISQLKNELSKQKQQNKRIEQEIVQIKKQKQNSIEEVFELKKNLNKNKKQYQFLERQIEEVKKENEEKQEKMKKLKQQNEQKEVLLSSMKEIQEDNEGKQSNIQQLKTRLQYQKQENTKLIKERQVLVGEIQKNKQTEEKKEEAVKESMQKVKESMQKVKQSNLMIEELNDNVNILKQIEKKLKDELKESQKKIHQMVRNQQQFEYREEQMKTQQSRKDQQLQILKQMFGEKASSVPESQVTQKYTVLKIQHNTLKEKFNQLQEKVDGVQTQFKQVKTQRQIQANRSKKTIEELTHQLQEVYGKMNEKDDHKGERSNSRKGMNSSRPRSVSKLTSYFGIFGKKQSQ